MLQISLAALLFLTVMLCLLAVIPRYRARGRDQADQFTWLALTDWRQDAAYAEFAKTTDFSDLITSLAVSNVGGARVLRKKFRLIRFAFLSGTGAVLLAGAIAINQSGLDQALAWSEH